MIGIKVRIWDKKNKEMIYLKDKLHLSFGRDVGHYLSIGQVEHSDYYEEAIEDFLPLFYTGLKDKRGNEIYQGDLIKNESGRICEVKWLHGSGRWDAFVRKVVEGDDPSGFNPEEWWRCVEIIGNIYENPG